MISVRNKFLSINKGGIIFVSLWYSVWLPMCFVVVCIMITEPSNWFLWVWMIFGAAGLIAVPLSFIELFTVYQFDKSESHYIITTSSLFRRRVVRINKKDFIGFEYEKDEDGRNQQSLYARYTKDGTIKKISVLFWQKNSMKDSVVNQLSWHSPNQSLHGSGPQ